MSFNNEARKVRDLDLPYGQRFRALASAVQLYRPIGYRCTWRYLEHRVGRDLRCDGTAMIEAVDLLAAARAIRNERHVEVAARRHAEKAAGHRAPGRAWQEAQAWADCRWHGEEKAAALFLLADWRRRRVAGEVASMSAELNGLIDVVLDRPKSWSHRRQAVLDAIHDSCSHLAQRPAARRWEQGRWVIDEDIRRARELRDLTWHVAIALDGPAATMPGQGRRPH